MFIYKITNKKNSKIYIGQTIRPIEQRFKRHISDAINCVIDTKFARAIRKYGKSNFVIEQIDVAATQEELNAKEQYWMCYYNTIECGYNETDALYKCGGNTYKSKTGKEMNEIIQKISNSKIGSHNPNAHKIKCLNEETKEELVFDTIKECKEFFGEKHHRFLTTRVKGNTKSLFKGIWNFAYANEGYKPRVKEREKRGSMVEVVDTRTGEIKTLPSLRSVERVFGISRNDIRKYINKHINDFVIKEYKIHLV